jgi:alkylhydroperoxidase/carboxymuconolactone decarboxylase family protein YurZ
MPAERLPMRKIREVLRLKYACGASDRVISRSVGIGRTAIAEYVRRAAVIGITWPIPEELDDTALERKLFAPAGYIPPRSKPLPDWGHVHAELRRRSVRNIGTDQLPVVSVAPLPINRRDAARTFVQEQFGSTIPGVVRYTTDVLFRDLWLCPEIAPRARSLVTISAVIATGQTAQLTQLTTAESRAG